VAQRNAPDHAGTLDDELALLVVHGILHILGLDHGVDAERLAITRRTIAEAMITYPALTRFPEVEDAGWSAINAALRGESSPRDAVEQIQRAAEEALA
jgi:hypothetical protein